MGLGRSFLDMLPRWFWCTIKLYITGIRLSPRMGSRTQVYDMVRCPCPPWWPFLPHLPWTSAPTQGKKLTWIFLRVCFAQYLFLPFFPYPITIDMIFFISYKVTGIILARVSNANVNKQLHSFYLQLLLLTIKNESANCPGFTVPSLLLTCQKGANMSGRATRKGAFKGQAHAQPVIGWTGDAGSLGGSAKQGSEQPLGCVSEKQPMGRANQGMAKQLPWVATRGRCLQTVSFPPGPLLPRKCVPA